MNYIHQINNFLLLDVCPARPTGLTFESNDDINTAIVTALVIVTVNTEGNPISCKEQFWALKSWIKVSFAQFFG